MRDRVNLLDMWIDRIDCESAVAQIDAFIRAGVPHQIVTVNVDFLHLGLHDPLFRDLINTADLVVPDGMPLLWAARMLGDPLPERVTGVELIGACARLAVQKDYRLFLLGAGPGIAEQAAAVLRQRYPGVRIVGTYAPPMGPFTPEEDETMVRMIQEMQPQMLFVAFGAPKQERWIRHYAQRLGVPVCMGVGGSFDFIAGRVKRAPQWMQDYGLEWLYRITQDPQRLWRRYFVNDLPVFFQLMTQRHAASGVRAAADVMTGLTAPGLSTSATNGDARTVHETGVRVVM